MLKPSLILGILLLVGTHLGKAQADLIDFRTQLLIKGTEGTENFGSDFSIRAQFSPMITLGRFIRIGPSIEYDQMHTYMRDLQIGAALMIGTPLFVKLEGFILRRAYETGYGITLGNGLSAALGLGYQLTQNLSALLSISAKYLSSGFPTQISIEGVPWLGFNASL